MEFSQLFFLYVLLPVTLLGYFLIPDVGRKNVWLLVVSLVFCGLCSPVSVPVYLVLTVVNFQLGKEVTPGKRVTMLAALAVNLAVLAALRVLNIRIPGIAFYTLSVCGYFADVYRKKIRPEESLLRFMLYLLMFPRLFQGPIVSNDSMRKALGQRRQNWRRVFEGVLRFSLGLGKKVLLADYCGRMIAELAEGSSGALIGAWLTAVLYMFRIYFDFSGYTDMAIGLGGIFGFRFPENFKLPYEACSIQEFCGRWHMSLGNYLKEYVYEPLCGKGKSDYWHYACMAITAVLGGLWHGFELNYLAWGLYFFVLIMAERLLGQYIFDLPMVIRRTLTMLAVLLGWVIFSNEGTTAMAAALKAMTGFGGAVTEGDGMRVLNCLPLLAACCLFASRWPGKLVMWWKGFCGVAGKLQKDNRVTALRIAYVASGVGFVVLMLWLCTVSRMGNSVQPSIFAML